MVQDIRIADYDYPLPDSRIALHPLADRDKCKLIAVGDSGDISHHIFTEIPGLLPEGTLLVANNTRVINARLEFFRQSGARIEIFLLEPQEPSDYQLAFSAKSPVVWQALIGNAKKWKEPEITKTVTMPDGRSLLLKARKKESSGASPLVELSWTPEELSFSEVVEAAGFIPIPPYLNRDAEDADKDDYQTVYSRINGSVAAPTAGLHFTPQLLEALDRKGVKREYVTLHVGAGTFRPVKSDTIGEHAMHTETFRVTLPLLDSLIAAMEEGRSIAAVGTTTVRTLESLPYLALSLRDRGETHVNQWQAYDSPDIPTLDLLKELRARIAGAESPESSEYAQAYSDAGLDASTAIMIAPGFHWHIVDTLITNFHQPQSTLLLLVDSFLRRLPSSADSESSSARQHCAECASAKNPSSASAKDQPLLWQQVYDEALASGYRFLSYGDACLFKASK